MKKLNYLQIIISVLLLSVIPIQTVFAEDHPVLLKKDNPGPGTMMLSRSVSTVIPVSATLNDTELGIFFSKSVGVAQITIEDETGAVVYQEVVNTNLTLESAIETGGWDSGNYNLRITYGSSKLAGAFQL